MLTVRFPDSYLPERQYITKIVLQDILGIETRVDIGQGHGITIEECGNPTGQKLYMADILFRTPDSEWLQETSLPKQPLKVMNASRLIDEISLVSNKVPVIFGFSCDEEDETDQYLVERHDGIHLGIDIFGSAFFMLTRYEEYVKPERDIHDRFPATASLAYQEGVLDRPIINEYIEILWWCIKRLWPRLTRKERRFKTIVSHDVDVPFAQAFCGISQLLRNCGGDIVQRRSLSLAFKRLQSWKAIRNGNYKEDLNYTFDRLMDISEKNNMKSAFYFKTDCTNPAYDRRYYIDHQYIRKLLREIHGRGHEIGFHPSYETYKNFNQTKAEFQRLLNVCEKEGIGQEQWGGRQHYLRWEAATTWRNWSKAGLDYDSSLAFADNVGFRCGICYEYPVYDLENRKSLSLIERPLIVMDGSLFGEQYMNKAQDESRDIVNNLRVRCKLFSGDFTLLWHNSSFNNGLAWAVYSSFIEDRS